MSYRKLVVFFYQADINFLLEVNYLIKLNNICEDN